MTTVYLHIGIPKTGTTSIQTFLFNNRDQLLEAGILYPLTRRSEQSLTSAYGHHKLSDSIMRQINEDSDLAMNDWQNLYQQIDQTKPKKVILSTENFCSKLNLDGMYLLKEYLKDYKTKVIVYLRRQDERLVSGYCQGIKMIAYCNTFQQFVLDHGYKSDYYKMLSPWAEIFGKENLIIRIYEREQLNDGLINDFLTSVDVQVKLPNYTSNKSYNVTPDYKAIKVMQYLNKFGMKNKLFKNILNRIYYRELKKSQSEVFKVLSKIPDSLISNELISEADRISIIKTFEESNRKVAQEYLNRQDGKLFYKSLF